MLTGTTKLDHLSHFRSFLSIAPDAMIVVDRAGRIVLANAEVEKLFGYKATQLQGKPVEILVPRRLRSRHSRHRRAYFSAPRTRPMGTRTELLCLRKDGTEFPAEISLAPVRRGGDVLIVSAIRDVSDRFRMEEDFRKAREELQERLMERTSDLRRSNQKLWREIRVRRRMEGQLQLLGDVVKSSDLAIINKKLDGTVVAWNPAARRMYGYSAGEMRGHSIAAIVPRNRRAEWRKIMAKIRRGESVERLETVRRKKNAERIPVLLTVSAVRDKRGKIVGARAVARDISRKMEGEAELRRQRDLAQRYLEIAGVIFLVLDRRGRVVLVNRKGCEVFGYKPAELLGRNWFKTSVPGNLRRKAEAYFRRLLSGKMDKVQVYETLCLTKSGQKRLIGWHHTLLRDENGRTTGILSSGEDLTEKRAMEESLRRISAQALHAQDEERRRISRELHDSTAQVLALLITELGRARKFSPAQESERNNILASAETLAQQALREVRSLSYLLHPPLLEDLGLVSALRAYSSRLNRESKVRIYLSVPSHLERLSNDVELAGFRIVQEAVSNALRHSHSQSVHIRLREEPGSLTVQVSDRGRGFARSATNGRGVPLAGNGMGILNMRERLDYLGGRLEIRSGRMGTRVRAVIPLSKVRRETTTHTLR